MADTRLILGGVSFIDFEIPEEIPFGMKQHLITHKLIGGKRVVDAMGPDPDDIQWKGRFRGPSALGRARRIETLCASGVQVPLMFGGNFWLVVVSHFVPHYERFYEIPYEVTCHVVDSPSMVGGGLVGGVLSAASSILGGTLGAPAALGPIVARALVTTISQIVSPDMERLDSLNTALGATLGLSTPPATIALATLASEADE